MRHGCAIVDSGHGRWRDGSQVCPLIQPGQRNWRWCRVPRRRTERRALHVLSGLRDDVDHPVEGIEAVNNRGGSFQYLDAFNLRKGDRKRFPEHEALAVDVDRATVHHHENFVGEELIVASCADIEVRTGDLHDIQPGYAAENSGNVGRARVPNVLVGDDVDVGGCLRDGLLMTSGDADGFFLFE